MNIALFSDSYLPIGLGTSIDTYIKRTLIMYEEVIKAFLGKIDEDKVQKLISEC